MKNKFNYYWIEKPDGEVERLTIKANIGYVRSLHPGSKITIVADPKTFPGWYDE